jgi:hypothetical protein
MSREPLERFLESHERPSGTSSCTIVHIGVPLRRS